MHRNTSCTDLPRCGFRVAGSREARSIRLLGQSHLPLCGCFCSDSSSAEGISVTSGPPVQFHDRGSPRLTRRKDNQRQQQQLPAPLASHTDARHSHHSFAHSRFPRISNSTIQHTAFCLLPTPQSTTIARLRCLDEQWSGERLTEPILSFASFPQAPLPGSEIRP